MLTRCSSCDAATEVLGCTQSRLVGRSDAGGDAGAHPTAAPAANHCRELVEQSFSGEVPLFLFAILAAVGPRHHYRYCR